MTENEKELLIKDLCARVPYGVKYMRYSWNFNTDQELPVIETLECADKDGYINHRRVYTVDDIKPYLFPLSSMTEELKYEFYLRFIANDCDFDYFRELCLDNGKWHKLLTSLLAVEEIIDWFHKNHLDYRGLIPMGLAIDASRLNIY